MVVARLGLVTLCVRDMPAMRSFYRNIGWEETESSTDNHSVFRTTGGILALFPLEEMIKEVGVAIPESSDEFKGFTLAINLESKELVDQAFEELRTAGATIAKEPQDVFWGGYSGYFVDPELNYWEVAWAPGAEFDDNGALLPFE